MFEQTFKNIDDVLWKEAGYVRRGHEELGEDKLGSLLTLKYQTVTEAAATLGGVPVIRETFTGFQRRLYGHAEPSDPSLT